MNGRWQPVAWGLRALRALRRTVQPAGRRLRAGGLALAPLAGTLRRGIAAALVQAGALAWGQRRRLALLAAALAVFVGLCSAWVVRRAAGRIHGVADAPLRPVAVVFGAGVWPDGTLSPMLRDRVDTAVDLYRQGKVQGLLLSGDHRHPEYDEPTAMRRHAMAAGVPARAIVTDPSGFRTFDTCARARAVFGIHRALLVTQGYHMPRAVYTCRGHGIDAVGVVSDRRAYPRYLRYLVREQISRTAAVLEVGLFRRPPGPPPTP